MAVPRCTAVTAATLSASYLLHTYLALVQVLKAVKENSGNPVPYPRLKAKTTCKLKL